MFDDYINNLMTVNNADICLLRNIDRDIRADILFASLWQKHGSKYRNVLRLVTKLYANCPLSQVNNWTLESQIDGNTMTTLKQTPVQKLEGPILDAIRTVYRHSDKMDWIQLANQLTKWTK